MDGKINAMVDGGPCSVGVESTIIDLTETPARLLRPGGITLEQLEAVLGEVAVDPAVTRLMGAGEQPKAPGMKYRHYAPKAPVTVVTGDPKKSAEYVAAHAGAGRTGVELSLTSFCLCSRDGLRRGPSWTWVRQGTRRGAGASSAQRPALLDHTSVPAIWAQCPQTPPALVSPLPTG